ncbi:uroporphyrinogen-III synthase [Metabacillus halosaccharovorans]|uniref:uroporphyrinogen-III synthase n=1 Tax=Metabacillus halosaccharovorans TaxID=930124 RepID=UPI00203B27F8|nr:uroporphyrinogen-III synthase [Metabacillus halosaccharovorans]MCM3444542.1 uroporphyrinogen-III synthase [Metabacillus halosaccharovorans]
MDTILPLQGKKVLITRAKAQVEEFIQKIEEVGGTAISTPLLEIKRNESNEENIKQTLNCLDEFDCIVFTSANGVTFFKKYLDQWNIPYSALQHMVAASVGRKTSKQMEKLDLTVSVIPEEFVAEKLAEKIKEKLQRDTRILVIRGNLARPVLIEQLTAHGFYVKDLVVYETVHNDSETSKLLSYIERNEIDFITFTSSSTVDSFMKVLYQRELLEHLKKVTFICIGPITGNTLMEYGFTGVMPDSYTIEDMIKVMIKVVENKEGIQ